MFAYRNLDLQEDYVPGGGAWSHDVGVACCKT